MPGVSGVTVVTTLVCSSNFACEAAGASRARHSLRPLLAEGGMFRTRLARKCVARSRSCGCLKFEIRTRAMAGLASQSGKSVFALTSRGYARRATARRQNLLSNIQVEAELSLCDYFVLLIGGAAELNDLFVCFARSPLKERLCIRTDRITELPTVAVDDLAYLLSYHVRRCRLRKGSSK